MTLADTTGLTSQTRGFRVIGRLFSSPAAVTGVAIVLVFATIAILAPVIAPYDPNATSWTAIRKAPSALHWLGTDELGRDVLSRIIYGARASLMAGVMAVVVAFLIGVPLGILSGYLGGWVDALIMRVVDAMLAIPYLVLAIAFAAFLGPSLGNVMIALGLSTAPILMRIARGQGLVVKVEEYIEASRAIGLSPFRIMWRHIFPNAVAPLIVQSTLAIATAIIAEASLAFLGLGQQPPAASWGSMLSSAKTSLDIAPWLAIYPGVAIYLTVLGFNLLGDGLRDALDPKD